jgi:hypothetical protein
MDYHGVHGHDISSFDLPLPHRLPTVSAADALEQLMTDRSRRVPTGLDALDRALSGFARHADACASLPGGFSKGQVIEVWGPPASGKTTFGLQLAAGVLKHDRNVVWVGQFTTCRKAALSPGRPVPSACPSFFSARWLRCDQMHSIPYVGQGCTK